MSDAVKMKINTGLLIFGLGGFISAILSYADLRSEVRAARADSARIQEAVVPMVRTVNELERRVDFVQNELKHISK
jgi:hypothetical protein